MAKIKELAIFYGWPSTVNGTYNVPDAINVFKKYHLVVFGEGLEDETHGDHINTVNIISGLLSITKVYGYIDSTLPLIVITSKIDKWVDMGVAGIFCDRFGYDFGLNRSAQNSIVEYIHSKNLSAFVNAWDPDDVFKPTSSLTTLLGVNDWFLAESYQIINDDYQTTDEWTTRSEKLRKYSDATGTNIATVTTSVNGEYNQSKLDYAYFSTVLYGFDAFGWGEKYFSATDSQLPYRPRKRYYGNKFASEIKNNGDVFVRYTNVGINVNTVTKKVNYII